MVGVRVTITRYVDDDQPGWVECVLTDAWGKAWLFVQKVPIVTTSELDSLSQYPQPGVIACQIVEKQRDGGGREVITVDTATPWGVETTTGEVRFDVLPEQLAECERGS
jgi:hypothetical protein